MSSKAAGPSCFCRFIIIIIIVVVVVDVDVDVDVVDVDVDVDVDVVVVVIFPRKSDFCMKNYQTLHFVLLYAVV